ncbi:hypothetical protein BTR22_05315 [Alkalihalophilus pseudofirmus]|uniref:hypothetical protein n=1 Tax=Alkalihalophilus pseudofirmus TaxID=79885 RepID=UPI000950BCA8|nr:hypothetical protein BTR22_05315 [Alkalihalophilus pseudofirmus]
MINLFDQSESSNDFQHVLDQAGHDITINEEDARAVITNVKLNINVDYDDRYISTLHDIKRGDVIDYNSRKWIILSEVEAMRHHKYKAIMRHLTHNIQVKIGEENEIVDYDRFGRPIYGDIVPIYKNIGAYAEQRRMVTTSGLIRAVDGDIMLTVSDNEDAQLIEQNHEFDFGGNMFRIYGIDKTQKGLLILNCERK